MVSIIIASNVGENMEFDIDSELTVGEWRVIVREMLGRSEEEGVKIMVRGRTLTDDGVLVSSLGLQEKEKVIVSIVVGHAVRPTNILPTARVSSEDPAHLGPNTAAKRGRDTAQTAQQLAAMEPMIEMMANNPGFMDMVAAMNPQLKQLLENHPELRRELQDPETIRMMLRAQFDPDARRSMDVSMQTQMAQINAMPGGAQALENAMHGIQRDLDAAQESRRDASDFVDASVEHSRPSEGTEANNRALPNPWSQQQQQQQQSQQPSVHPSMFPSPYSMMNPLMQQQQQQQPPNHLPPTQQYGNGGAPTTDPFSFFGVPPGSQHGSPTGSNSSPTTAALIEAMMNSPTFQNSGFPAARTLLTLAQRAEQYKDQINALKEMGFDDVEQMVNALDASNGDVDGAVDYIAEHDDD